MYDKNIAKDDFQSPDKTFNFAKSINALLL